MVFALNHHSLRPRLLISMLILDLARMKLPYLKTIWSSESSMLMSVRKKGKLKNVNEERKTSAKDVWMLCHGPNCLPAQSNGALAEVGFQDTHRPVPHDLELFWLDPHDCPDIPSAYSQASFSDVQSQFFVSSTNELILPLLRLTSILLDNRDISQSQIYGEGKRKKEEGGLAKIWRIVLITSFIISRHTESLRHKSTPPLPSVMSAKFGLSACHYLLHQVCCCFLRPVVYLLIIYFGGPSVAWH